MNNSNFKQHYLHDPANYFLILSNTQRHMYANAIP